VRGVPQEEIAVDLVGGENSTECWLGLGGFRRKAPLLAENARNGTPGLRGMRGEWEMWATRQYSYSDQVASKTMSGGSTTEEPCFDAPIWHNLARPAIDKELTKVPSEPRQKAHSAGQTYARLSCPNWPRPLPH